MSSTRLRSAESRGTALALAFLLSSVAGVQLGFTVAVSAFDRLSAVEIALFRFALVGVVLAAIWQPRRADLVSRNVWFLAGSLTGLFIFLLLALERVPVATVTTVAFLGPLSVAVRHARNRKEIAWASVAATGVVLLGAPEVAGEPVGIALSVLAGVFWGVYIEALARNAGTEAGNSGLSVASTLAAVFTLPIVFAVGPSSLGALTDVLPTVIAFSLLAGLLPLAAEFQALRRIRSHAFGVFMSLEPAFAALWGFLILGQELSLFEIAAIALVTLASAGTFATAPRSEPPR